MNTAIMICTHGRPDNQLTLKTLRELGYTGQIWLVLDNEDETYSCYHHNFGLCDDFVTFNKQYYIDHSDTGTIEDQRKCILYAKNCCEDWAKKKELDAFIIADDDITGFRYRYEKDGHLLSVLVTKNMDKIIEAYYTMIVDNNISASSFGDVRAYIGGVIKESRLPYNFVFRNTKYPFEWKSFMYEDTVSPIYNNMIGRYTVQLPQIQFNMKEVDAKEDGGMKAVYEKLSVYKRAFTAKVFNPTSIEIANNKVGFELKKDNTFPKLVSSKFKCKI